MKKATTIFLNFLNILIKVLIVLTSIAVQLGLVYFFFFYVQTFELVYYVITAFSIIPIVRIYNSNQNLAFKFSWMALIFAFPYIGVICYLLFGKGKTLPKSKLKKVEKYIDEHLIYNDNIEEMYDNDGHKHCQLLHNLTKFPLYKNTLTEFINDGELWFNKMLNDIKQAKKYIFMEYFVISDGIDLQNLYDILVRKADEGVIVKIIYDDIGSKRALKQKTVDKINNHKNIEMISYNPVGLVFSLKLNYRNHRKICIIDSKIAYCGGSNIADEYTHKINRFGYWRDNANRYVGDAIYSFLLMFTSDWYMSTLKKLDIEEYKKDIVPVENNNSYVFPFPEGPTIEKKPAYSIFNSLINNVDHTLYISTPYFIIDRNFIDALCTAAQSGIDVRLLIPGIPDKKIIYTITSGHLGKLLKSGVKVYEYTPGFNHAKNFIIDDDITFNGTINLDFRSLYLHFECGALHFDKDLNSTMKKDFLNAIEKSTQLNYETWRKRPWFRKLFEFILTIIYPLL